MESNEESFDPLSDVKEFLTKSYREGKLPLMAIIAMILTNLLLFSYPVGYELYIFLPIVATIMLLLTQYWELSEQNFGRRMIAHLMIALSAGLDLLVSLSFTFFGSSITIRALPPLFFDIIAIGSYIAWMRGYKLE